MDMIIGRQALLKPLQAISSVVEKKQTLPILANVLLSIKDDQLLLTGTDLEIELVSFVAIEQLFSHGTATVSARKLFEICRTLPEDASVRLSLEKNFLAVRAGQSSFLLNTLPAADFPMIEETEFPLQFRLKQHQLKNLLAKTYFAMGQQDVRHYLNGTFLDIEHKIIKCIAADGHRLALASLTLDNANELSAKAILPRKSVLELLRLLNGDDDSEATIYLSDDRFQLATTDFIFTTKLINAQYPDYNRLIPRGTTTALGDREVIKQALTRASILSSEKFRGVRFQLEPNKLRIMANNSDQEQAEEALSFEYAGNPIEIGFNVAYLLDIVSTITTKSIRWVFTDATSGVLIEPEDSAGLYVVMPMRL